MSLPRRQLVSHGLSPALGFILLLACSSNDDPAGESLIPTSSASATHGVTTSSGAASSTAHAPSTSAAPASSSQPVASATLTPNPTTPPGSATSGATSSTEPTSTAGTVSPNGSASSAPSASVTSGDGAGGSAESEQPNDSPGGAGSDDSTEPESDDDNDDSEQSDSDVSQDPTSDEASTSETEDDEPPPGSNDAPCDVPDFVFDEPSPIGWASQNGGTTGGGSETPVLVTSRQQFQAEIGGDEPKVIYVQGDFEPTNLDFGSNKTIIGCSSGAHLRGHLSIGSGSSNLILRNLEISGYGAGDCSLDPDYDPGTGCSSGNDAVSVNGTAHHVWFDHCAVKDGTDGNLDITNNADFVTVSWTKFSYTPRTDDSGDDSTGGAGHRYSNLVGGSDSEPDAWPETIPLNVTWHHNWWAENVVERQPRVRYGRNHLFNNLYDSDTANYCVRAGIEASILLEGNYFDGVDTPHEFNSDDDRETAFIALGTGNNANVYDDTSGDQAVDGGGETFTPPYEYTLTVAQDVPTLVMAGAGPQ